MAAIPQELMYPECILEATELDKRIRTYRAIVNRGKEAEILLDNMIQQHRLRAVRSAYEEDKLTRFKAKNKSAGSSRKPFPELPTRAKLPVGKARPKSASVVPRKGFATQTSEFSDLFAKTMEWPQPRTLPPSPSKHQLYASTSDLATETLVGIFDEIEKRNTRPSTAGALRSATMTRPKSATRLKAVERMLSSRQLSKEDGREGRVREASKEAPKKERATFLVQLPNNTVMEAEQLMLKRQVMRRASLNLLASRSHGGTEDAEDELDDCSTDRPEPQAVFELAKYYTLVLWKVAVRRAEGSTIYVSVAVKREHDEAVYVVASEASAPHRTLAVARVSLDDLWIQREAASFMPKYAVSSLALSSLGELLSHMCESADFQATGHVSRADFERILVSLDLGVNAEDLASILSEADPENVDIVDYTERIPKAIEMVQAYQAKSKIHALQRGSSHLSVHHTVCDSTYSTVCRICLDMFSKADTTFLGTVSMNVFRNRLRKALAVGLTPTEAELIGTQIPKDSRGHALYKFFKDVYYDIRFQAAKSSVLDSAGSDLHKFLLDLFTREDILYSQEVGRLPDGRLPLSNVVSRLLSSSRLSLSRAQVLILCAEAPLIDGLVSVYDFAPVLASMIEIMVSSNESKAMTDLLSFIKTDLNTLSEDNTLEDLLARLNKLFKMTDRDLSGELDFKEFASCLADLDVGLKPAEISMLFVMADVDRSGYVSQEEFKSFCLNVLAGVIKEKMKIRSFHRMSLSLGPMPKTDRFEASLSDYRDLLRNIYLSVSKSKSVTGISYSQYEEQLRALHLDLTQMLLDVLLSEVDPRDGVLTDTAEVLDIQSGLLHAFHAITPSAEQAASIAPITAKARVFTLALNKSKISQTAKALLNALRMEDSKSMRNALARVMRSPFCSYSRCAANHVITHLRNVPLETLMSTSFIDDVCTDAVSVGVLRLLVHKVDPNVLFKAIVTACQHEAQRLHGALYVDESRCVIPLRSCIRILYECRCVSFSQADILSILIQSEDLCVDRNQLPYSKLARIAVEHYRTICAEDEFSLAIQFQEYAAVNDDALMHGLTKYHLMDHLRSCFTHCEDALPEKSFMDVLLLVPSVQLKVFDSNLLAAFCEIDSRGFVLWKDFITYSYSLLYSLFQQKYLIQRLPLFRLQEQLRTAPIERRISALHVVKMAEEVLTIAKVDTSSGTIEIKMPSVAGIGEERKDRRKVHYRKGSIPKPAHKETLVRREVDVLGYEDVYSVEVGVLITVTQRAWGDRNEAYLSVENDCVTELGVVKRLQLKLPSHALVEEAAAEDFAMSALDTMRIQRGKSGPIIAVGH